MYKGAIVGCGSVACQAHLPAWHQAPACEIVAVVDPEPARLTQARALLPEARCYRHLEALLAEEELDFLDVCTPPAMHSPIILQACAHGVHVLCEKPLTVSAQALRQITTAAATAGVLVFPVHNWKYAPLFQALKRLLESGEIGRPTYVELTTLRTAPAGTNGWRLDPSIAGGGILMDHGWHAFYLLLFLLGELPEAIAARIERRRLPAAGVEDTATCEVIFPHACAHIHLTWTAEQRRNQGVIRGEQGEIRLEDTRLVVCRNAGEQYEIHLPAALSAGSYHPDWLASLLGDFQAALQEPWRYSAGLQEAETCLRLILLAYRSAALNTQSLPYTQAFNLEVV
jgi:predicted dehydrogenase